MMSLMPDGSWEVISSQVDWERIDRTTDAEIELQEIADLVEDALELEEGSLTALAARLEVSPASVRRWRRGRVMPSMAHQQRLKRLFADL
jgi:ribosome-binding protein aMBF1 (putative translation factor)